MNSTGGSQQRDEELFDALFTGGPAASDDVTPAVVVGPPRKRRRRVWRVLLAVVLVLGGIAGAVAYGSSLFVRSVTNDLDQSLERFGDPFAEIPATARPTVAPAGGSAINFLLVGSDSRISAGNPNQWVAGAQRTDAIMIVHLPADRSGAFVMSIPRDSWVDVPGHGKNKINAAYSFGGPTLMIQTIEQLTDVRIDHFAILDFEGFKTLTDQLGGVTITIPKDTGFKDTFFKAGTYRMTGEQALAYVRQRKNLPGGDFDRISRQQNWVRSVIAEMREKGNLTDPEKFTKSVEALGDALVTDDSFDADLLRALAFDYKISGRTEVRFFTVPTAGTGRSPDGKQSIVKLDAERDAALWEAIRNDSVAQWLVEHKARQLAETVR